jgi:DNA-binding NtrC family response regulator
MSERNSARPRVLVLDDEALIRWALGESLRAAGYGVVEAATVSEAFRLIGDPELPLDAACVDLRLPDGSGLAVVESLQRAQPECSTVLMTAYGTPDANQAAKERGALAIVNKPFDLGEMMQLLGTHLRDRFPGVPGAASE